MKKTLTAILLIAMLATPSLVFAQDIGEILDDLFSGDPDPVGPKEMNAGGLLRALGRVVNWLFAILLIAAVIFIIIAAFNFITAAGEPDKISKARHFVLYALVGVGIAAASKGLVALVGTIIGG